MKTYIRKYAAGQGIAGEESLKQVIVVTVASSSVTTVRSLIMAREAFVAGSGSKFRGSSSPRYAQAIRG